jgi:hypothetical protein
MNVNEHLVKVPVFSRLRGRRRNDQVRAIYAALAAEDGGERRSLWDRILGMATVMFVSAGGWAAVIAAIRLMR